MTWEKLALAACVVFSGLGVAFVARYEHAQRLHEQTGNVLGQANCIQGLGDLARARSDYDTPRSATGKH
jgi:hypothetical protein